MKIEMKRNDILYREMSKTNWTKQNDTKDKEQRNTEMETEFYFVLFAPIRINEAASNKKTSKNFLKGTKTKRGDRILCACFVVVVAFINYVWSETAGKSYKTDVRDQMRWIWRNTIDKLEIMEIQLIFQKSDLHCWSCACDSMTWETIIQAFDV